MSAFIRRALILGTVIVLAGVAGLLAAGGAPQDIERDLTAAQIPAPTTTLATTTSSSSTPTSTSTSTTTTTTDPQTTDVVTTAANLTTAPAAESSAVAESSEPEPTSTTTVRTTTSLRPTTTTERQTTDAPTTTDPDESVVVVIANASNTFGLATQSVDDVQAHGYVFVITTDGEREMAESAIYFADGSEDAAMRLASQLGADGDLVGPLPDERLFKGTAQPEVLLLLGNNWAEVTNLDD